MSKNYRPWNPDQPYLLPPSPREWLAEGHLAYVLLDVVEELDLQAIEAKYQAKDGRGVVPYDPRMMTALLFYGYCTGRPSSRGLERATYEDVAVRVLAGEQHPDHSRISEFRRANLKELTELFVQVLRLCQKAGLAKLGHVALDGTKVKANASKHKAMSYERMLKTEAELEQEVADLLAGAEQADQSEDAKYGKGRRGDELPEELRRRQERLEKIRQAKAELEAEAAAARARELSERAAEAEGGTEPRDGDDPEPPDGGGKRKRVEAVRAQAAAAREKAAKKAAEASQPTPDTAPRDRDTLPNHQVQNNKDGEPAPKAQRNFTDPDSRIMKRDGGYLQGYNAQAAVDGDHQIIVAVAVTNQAPDVEHLRPMLVEIEKNCGRLPETLSADSGYWSDDNSRQCDKRGVDAHIATGRERPGSGEPAETGGQPRASNDLKERMKAKLGTEDGRKTYGRRKTIVEPVFGQLRGPQGLANFALRGLEKVRAEWSLYCMAHNLRKLHRARAQERRTHPRLALAA